MKNGLANVLASFPSASMDLLLLAHDPEAAELSFVFGNGDIVLARYLLSSPNSETATTELVGLIDCGISAACWSIDEETLLVVSGENNLLVFSKSFETIAEKHMDSSDLAQGDNKHISVGWGKEETQFKGKGFKALERERQAIKHAGLDLKESAALRDPTISQAQEGTLSSEDDRRVRISWRGDSEFFAVSTIEAAPESSVFRRVIRVFSRQGELDSVSEATDGLEHNLAWRPSGAVIASTQRTVDEVGDSLIQVSFFERNGLRHGEFNTRLDPCNEQVGNLAWSSNGELLALKLRNRVILWTTKNYHWYLKQELFIDQDVAKNTVLFVKFNPEKPLQMMIGTSLGDLFMYDLAYTVTTGPTVVGLDVGMVAVVDGCKLKITPLAHANVPPPMAYAELDVPASLVSVSVSKSNNTFAALTSDHNLHILSTKNEKSPEISTVEKIHFASGPDWPKQTCFIESITKNTTAAVLVDTEIGSTVVLYDIADLSFPISICKLEKRAVLMKSSPVYDTALVEYIDGSVVEVLAQGTVTALSKFPALCVEVEVVNLLGELQEKRALGLTSSGKLYCGEVQLSSGVTSFKVTDNLLAATTAQSRVFFVHLGSDSLSRPLAFAQAESDERVRQIERGSMLVTCIPTKYSVIFQAPRGNLETIYPRIMVLTAVRLFLSRLEYMKAFVACRTHRIDLDILYDYDRNKFEKNAAQFVLLVGRVDYLDLFVSCLHPEDVTKTKYRNTLTEKAPVQEMHALAMEPELPDTTKKMIVNKEKAVISDKINRVCLILLQVLTQAPFEVQFLQTRVTAYACQEPPNLPGALQLISSLDDTDKQEAMLTHLCFLLDVNKLYNHALEAYDLQMALNVAQKSQKDPKEYLPFLQNLQVQKPLERQFLVDDYLNNHGKALQWLVDMGADASDRFFSYLVEHLLYKKALAMCKYDAETAATVYGLYADYLYGQKNYVEAALVYEYLGSLESALDSYIQCKRWAEAISIVHVIDAPELLQQMAQALAAALRDDHRFEEAAEIMFRILKNVEEAVLLFCKGYRYEQAILLATEQKQQELLKCVVDVQLDEEFGTIAELLADCTSQAKSQLNRLRELRQKKESDPHAFYGVAENEDTPDNVSVAASETSTTPSFFTKYTGKTAGTAKTSASRKTSKNRKREERKRAKGRKGTVYEEEYLIKSVGRLVERLDQTEMDATSLMEGLIRRKKLRQAYLLQQNWGILVDFLKEHIVEIHHMSDRDRERLDDDGKVYFIEEIPVPTIREMRKFELLDY